jgi:Ferritin-like domain
MMCQNWGYERLAVKIRAESIGEMNHAEKVIERIRHLEGIPNLTRLEEIRVGERAVDQLQFDHEVENVAIGRFNRSSRSKSATAEAARCSNPPDPLPSGGRNERHKLARFGKSRAFIARLHHGGAKSLELLWAAVLFCTTSNIV